MSARTTSVSSRDRCCGLADTPTIRSHSRRGRQLVLLTVLIVITDFATCLGTPTAFADNSRFNNSVVSNVYTLQRQAGCREDLHISPPLRLAAQWHADDVLNNRALDADMGSDNSTTQGRANAAGYRGTVAETVGINPALSMSGIELINQWYYNPAYLAIMQNCAFTQIGVWSDSSPDRTVVVAVYGHPA